MNFIHNSLYKNSIYNLGLTILEMSMKYNLERRENYAIFSLEEDNLNSIIAPSLKSEFVFFRNEEIRNLIFDFSKVKYVDSSGLSAILTANRLWKGYGSFVLTQINSPIIMRLIKISKLETILRISETLDEAIDMVLEDEAERQEI
jgi:anti-anti-sigma factor